MSRAPCASAIPTTRSPPCSAAVPDWSGGTRIASSLRAFNKHWARRVLGQGAIVLLITDGLERDADDTLAFEIDRLHRSCRRLIWLNPLLRFEGFEARARGIKTMLPHVDEFRPIHNLESMADLVAALQAAAAGPATRKRGCKRWRDALYWHTLVDDSGAAEAGDSGLMLSTDNDILKAAEDWRKAGRAVALATVVETWGSAPRPVGSNLVIDQEGNFLGSVSGGCVEGAVVTEALDVIEAASRKCWNSASPTRPPGRSGCPAAARSGCSSRRWSRVKPPMKLDILTALNAERAARRAAIVVTNVESGEQRLVKAADIAKDPLRPVLAEHLRTGKSGMEQTAEGRVFLTVHVPAPQLVIIGAVHISQALAPIGKLLGYDVTIVDPRTAFASPERFPGRESRSPNGRTWRCRRSTSTATPPLSRSRMIRRSTIRRCSMRWRATVSISARSARGKPMRRRIERLKAQGVSDADLARIQAPIGLDIGAVSPAEIAVAIMAQITERLREEAEPAEELAEVKAAS